MARLGLETQGRLGTDRGLPGRDRGSGTTQPTADLRRGDVYFRTDLGFLTVYTGADWREASAGPVLGKSWEGDYGNDPATISVPNLSQTAVPYTNTIIANDHIRRETGGTVFTVLEDGIYAITASLRFAAGGTQNGERYIVLMVTSTSTGLTSPQSGTALITSGINVIQASMFVPAGGVATPVLTLPGRKFTAGQQFQIQAWQGSGAALSTNGMNWSKLLVARTR